MTAAPPLLLLASSSPRRRELLARAGIPFAPVTPGPEPEASGTPAERAVQRARSKALGAVVVARPGPPWVLGVDTVVEVAGREHGKAADRQEAAAMLAAMAGQDHLVHTAHCLWDPGTDTVREELVTATVHCRAIGAGERDAWLDSEHWRGKAGAYGIQDPLATFVSLRAGPFDAVVGLHVAAVRRLLAGFAAAGGGGR